MREERFGDLLVRITGGEDRQGGGQGPLVVLMHGFGAPGTDLLGLWRVLDVPPSVRFAFPEAPHELPGMFGARAWWMIDPERMNQSMAQGPRNYANEIPPGMEEATDQLLEMLSALQDELDVPNERLLLGGFSQGSMLACNAVFARELMPGGLLILSGTPVNMASWKTGMASRRGLPVFQSHGERDPLLSFQAAEQLRDEMGQAGLRTEWQPFRGGHEIPLPVLRSLGLFLSALSAD
jgi:phospholipase/carboxylesterase